MLDRLLKQDYKLSVYHERAVRPHSTALDHNNREPYEFYNALLFLHGRKKYSASGDTAQEAIQELVELASHMEGLVEDEKQ